MNHAIYSYERGNLKEAQGIEKVYLFHLVKIQLIYLSYLSSEFEGTQFQELSQVEALAKVINFKANEINDATIKRI